MFKKLDQMKLKKRLTYGFQVIIVMMITLGVVNMVGLGVLYRRINNFANGSATADTAVKTCRIEINVAARNIREMVINTSASARDLYKQNVDANIAEIDRQMKILKETGMLDDELYQEFEDTILGWEEIGLEIIQKIDEQKDASAYALIINKCIPALEKTIEISEKIDTVINAEKDYALKICTIVAIGGLILTSTFITVACVSAMKISKKVIGSVLEPLAEIETVTGELTNGNLHSRLEYRSDDEIGHLAHDLRKAIRILGSYIDEIGDYMEKFSSGDFTVDTAVEWKGDFEAIHNSFRSFEGTMADTVKGIQMVANQVSAASEQVAASANDLADGATEQTGITEELSGTIDDVSMNVRQNAQDAKEISKDVENLGTEIINSNQKMQEMVASMNEINDASTKISKIIAAINDIANQTNLLALNASIEAARAGDAGRGFMVVADQVSVLAAQSADAAKESDALIQASMEAVKKGMVIANETAEQLEQVLEDSKVITEQVNGVAVIMENQADSMNQITAGVEQINQVVQTNSATSEECAAASQEMSSQAENLENLIRKFKVK